MKSRPFHIVDVFAEDKYQGNQLAVFSEAGHIPEAEMQPIAREMNFSETTFILSNQPRRGGYDVRIFTPGQEVPFAGHPTLGTAFIIHRTLEGGRGKRIVLNLKVGPIPVELTETADDRATLWMTQIPPVFGKVFDRVETAATLGLSPADLADDHPVQEVSTGCPFVIVPLKSLDAVRRTSVDLKLFEALVRDAEARAVLVFAPETYRPENDLNVRMFAHALGVPEDPATGSANGCLAGYLVKHRFFGKELDIHVEQGYEIRRPSLLMLRASAGKEGIDVRVGGQVILVAEGRFV